MEFLLPQVLVKVLSSPKLTRHIFFFVLSWDSVNDWGLLDFIRRVWEGAWFGDGGQTDTNLKALLYGLDGP